MSAVSKSMKDKERRLEMKEFGIASTNAATAGVNDKLCVYCHRRFTRRSVVRAGPGIIPGHVSCIAKAWDRNDIVIDPFFYTNACVKMEQGLADHCLGFKESVESIEKARAADEGCEKNMGLTDQLGELYGVKTDVNPICTVHDEAEVKTHTVEKAEELLNRSLNYWLSDDEAKWERKTVFLINTGFTARLKGNFLCHYCRKRIERTLCTLSAPGILEGHVGCISRAYDSKNLIMSILRDDEEIPVELAERCRGFRGFRGTSNLKEVAEHQLVGGQPWKKKFKCMGHYESSIHDHDDCRCCEDAEACKQQSREPHSCPSFKPVKIGPLVMHERMRPSAGCQKELDAEGTLLQEALEPQWKKLAEECLTKWKEEHREFMYCPVHSGRVTKDGEGQHSYLVTQMVRDPERQWLRELWLVCPERGW